MSTAASQRSAGPCLDDGTAALVFKIGRYRLHHGPLNAIRTLARAGVAVYGVHEDRWAPAALSRHLAGAFAWPTARDVPGQDGLVDGLRRIAARIARPCVVIPTDDVAAIFLDECATQLPAGLILPRSPRGLVRGLCDKRTYAELARGTALRTPRSRTMVCPVAAAAVDVELPVVVKRVERAVLADGTRTFGTVIARTAADLRAVLGDPSTGPYEVLLQELVGGQDWLYHGYCDSRSEPLVGFTGRKLASRPAGAGETAYARAEPNPELRRVVEGFLRSIRYVGPVSMDLRWEPAAGTAWLLDVNPRIGACFRVFETHSGIDVVRAMHLDLSGRAVPPAPQRDGRTYVVEGYDFEARRQTGARVGQAAIGTLRRVARADARAWLQRDDPAPMIAAAIQLLAGEPRRHTLPTGTPLAPQEIRWRSQH